MDFLEKIRKLRELEMRKYRLEKELEPVCNSIKEEKDSCKHIVLHLGDVGFYPFIESKCCCLICGKSLNNEYSENVVEATDYLPQYDISDQKQCNNKFAYIQTVAIGLLKDEPNMTSEELVDKLNGLIEQSISIKDVDSCHRLVKNKNLKN